VERDEVRCPKSRCSIDMIVHDSGQGMGGERSSKHGHVDSGVVMTTPWLTDAGP
jgi:hypothetical protein